MKMIRALPCNICGNGEYLSFKTINEEEWWISCDDCGHIGKVGKTRQEAGENWNKEIREDKTTE